MSLFGFVRKHKHSIFTENVHRLQFLSFFFTVFLWDRSDAPPQPSARAPRLLLTHHGRSPGPSMAPSPPHHSNTSLHPGEGRQQTLQVTEALQSSWADSVSPSTLKLGADQLSLLFIFSISLQTCHIPVCFKTSTIIPKPNTVGLNDLRSVALTSGVMNLKHLKPSQFPFRPHAFPSALLLTHQQLHLQSPVPYSFHFMFLIVCISFIFLFYTDAVCVLVFLLLFRSKSLLG